MFESLDDQIKADDLRETSASHRLTLWIVYALVGVAACFGLFYGIQELGG